MPGNRYGALGASFQIVRIFQGISLIAIIGMTANFIAQMVNDGLTPPNLIVGVISVVRRNFAPELVI